VIVEPIQGRGGIRVPPPGFLRSLADLCRDEGLILIADEVYTGVRRTGPFLACERDGVAPDAVCLGKALGGGMPVSACLMRPALANAVARLPFEAAHTSTFLGHPLACAAGLAVLRTLDLPAFRGAPERIEAAVRARGADWRTRLGCVVRDVRGAGAMMGIELSAPDGGPGGPLAARVCAAALRRGVLVLTEGEAGDVLSLTPPLVVADGDLHRALDRLEASLTEALT
jgi:acetylornithine/succinyldiaminopimelate/putrescine aminotransferase